ncbi:MAG: DNA primase [Lachnospiraceae bacterium]|nr:DNA primase [Lachnospiraceae bacterium]
MRYSDDLVEEIRMKNDIVDVISGYVKLTRKGSSYFGLCPFHNEKSPSFSVSPGKQMYYCFGCGAGGNVFTFLMEYENFTFVEALKFLAERAGIELPQMEYSKEAKEQADLKNTLLEINKKAAKFYYYQLRTERGKAGYEYLKNRGLSDETIQKFGLGYSDKYGNLLYRYLKEQGYSDEILRQSGMFNADEVHGMQDKFWNRVIFPIMDANSRVIGFGGRVMGDGKPKYLNSPETKIFDKSRNLYGLHVARSSRRKNLIICEGYMDVISMHQAGFQNAVASLGTALTSLQASLMKRYTDEVLVIYDSDEAGVKAALRAIPLLKGVGLTAKVVNLRPYKDPDEFIRNEGCEAFEKRLEEAENSFLYEIRMREQNYDLSDPQGRTDFLHDAAARLVAIEDEIERNSYTEAIARKYHVTSEMMNKLVGKLALQGAGRAETVKPRSLSNNKKDRDSGAEKAQKLMLTWMTSYPEMIGEIEKYITPEDFTTTLYHQVAEMIYLQYHEGNVNPAKLLNQFVDSEEQNEVAGLFNAGILLETDEERKRALKDVICNMKENSIAYRSEHMDVTDMAALQKLMADKRMLERWKAGNLSLNFDFT